MSYSLIKYQKCLMMTIATVKRKKNFRNNSTIEYMNYILLNEPLLRLQNGSERGISRVSGTTYLM